ncbi:unnamed protein product [Caenorhabditis brenneri]
MKILSLIAMMFVARQVESHVTTFEYYGTIVCPQSYVFCSFGYYIEYDHLSSDDDHAELPFICATGKTIHHVVLKMTDDEDIGLWGGMKKYEPALEIIHNCTSGTKALMETFYFEKTRIWEKTVKQNYTINIFDKGTSTHNKPILRSDLLPEGTGEWVDGRSRNWNPKIVKHTGEDIAEYLPVPKVKTDYEMMKGLNGSSEWVPIIPK